MACPYNSKTNNLEQGLLYRSNENNLKERARDNLDLLQSTTGPWSGSALEGFVDSATQIPADKPLGGGASSKVAPPPPQLKLNILATTPGASNLEKMEDQFNKLLAEYTSKYKLMSQELISNNDQTVLQKYANNNVKLNNNYYYVNSYGFASKYDNESWKDRSVGCSQSPIEIPSEDFKKLLKGPPMGKGQACNVAGFNIRGEDGWTGWVDIKGIAHHYPNMDVWTNRNQSCTMNALSLTDDEVKSMPKGSDMTQNTFCERLNVDPKILQSLASLNSQMLALGNQIKSETEKLAQTDQHLDEQLKGARNRLDQTMKKLHQGHDQSDSSSDDTFSSGGPGEGSANIKSTFQETAKNSELVLKMNYLKYVIGLIAVVLLVIFSFHVFASDRQSIVSIIILVLVIIYVLSNAWTYIYRKFL